MTAILDLPDWGEVRMWVASRPLSPEELSQARHIVDDFLAKWQTLSVNWLYATPDISDCEVFANQALAFGYAAVRLSDGMPGSSQPFYMTGSDIDPLLDVMDLFASQQTPLLELGPDDAIILDGIMSPMSTAALALARQGRLGGESLIMTGGPIARWRYLGAIHPLRNDSELFATFKVELASQGIELT